MNRMHLYEERIVIQEAQIQGVPQIVPCGRQRKPELIKANPTRGNKRNFPIDCLTWCVGTSSKKIGQVKVVRI